MEGAPPAPDAAAAVIPAEAGQGDWCRDAKRFGFWIAAVMLTVVVCGCSRRRPVVTPPASVPAPPAGLPPSIARTPSALGHFTEKGIASWYGAKFNGRRTSDGEIYNMFEYTAAHRTLPFGSIVEVTNLDNGKHVDVRINDRGPFVANRIIDLSYSAAVAIGMIGTGTAPVKLRLVNGSNPDVGPFGVQVGAFQDERNAEKLRDRLAAEYSPVTIRPADTSRGVYYRVRVGRLSTKTAAQNLAERIEAREQLDAIVVRLDN